MRKTVFGGFRLGPAQTGLYNHRSCISVAKKTGADQLLGDREADLRLCFRICKKPVFS